MKYYLTKEEMDKIEELADYALSAHNKQDAKKYVQQIRLAVNDVWGASNNILNEMVAAIDNATGMVSDKEIKVSTCYEGWTEQGELVGKVMSAGFEDGKTFQKLREATIKTRYNTEEVKLRVLNGDGAGWVKNCEDPDTIFQLDRFHIYQKILKCIKDKEMQSRLRNLYDACKIEELLESIQIYADSIASGEAKDTGEKKAKELYKYLAGNKSYLLSYQDREGIEIPKAPAGIVYKNLGTQENQNCSNITLRMKNNKSSWSIAGGVNTDNLVHTARRFSARFPEIECIHSAT